MFSGYVFAFLLSAVACLGAGWRARSVPNPDTRRALMAFFFGSGAWAGSYVGFLLVDSALGKHLFYQLSLLIGFGTVWAWLWFCSAYSGRNLHRNALVQRLAVFVYAAITLLKVTNPLHGLYYGLEATGGPFGVVVSHGMLYWVVMALSYALATAGYVMIFELFLKAGARILPLGILTGLTALPAAFNMIVHADRTFLDITHEPLGVAVFAVGLLFVYETQFRVVHRTSSIDEPHLILGSGGRIRGLGGGITSLPPLDSDALEEPLAEILPGLAETIQREESTWTLEIEGKDRHYRVLKTDPQGPEATKTVVLSDITRQRKRERELQRSERRFRAMLNDPNILAGLLAPNGTFLEVNNTALEYIEASRQEVLGQPFWETPWWKDEDRPLVRDKVMRASGGEYVELEAEHRRPNGERRIVTGTVRPVTDEEGEVVSLFVSSRDITERKRREQRANQLRQKYQTLLKGAPDAIIIADQKTGRIEEVNQEAAELLRASPQEIIGRNQAELHPEEEIDRYRQVFEGVCRRSARTGESETVRRFEDGSPLYVQDDTGEKVPVAISATTIDLKERSLILGIFRDVREQREREQALREAKEGAEEASRMKSSMLANMSHEIRTPLTSVIGFAEAIGDEIEENSTVANFADLIADSGHRLLETLDAVLNLSKLEAGKLKLQAQPVDLGEQARQVAEEFVQQAQESGIDMAVDVNRVLARADEGGIQIVLQNLLSNAIKYTEEGAVGVRTYRQDGKAVLEVQDTGIGMDSGVAERLFEPFRQASEGLAREYEGTGVGLALTKRAIEQMEGSIDVDTQDGEGSRFTVRLPVVEDNIPSEAEDGASKLARQPTGQFPQEP